MSSLLQNLPLTLKKLDVSYNKQLSKSAYIELARIISSPFYKVEILSLEGNEMGDECCGIICEAAL